MPESKTMAVKANLLKKKVNGASIRHSSLSSEGSQLSEIVSENLGPSCPTHERMVFFKEVNPETDTTTVFERDLAESKDQNTLVKTYPPEQRIAKEIGRYMRDSNKKVYSRKDKKVFPVLPLSNPKGTKLRTCEVCPAKGTLCCAKCTVTYYCTWTHCRSDKIHHALCDRIKMIRWPIPFRFSETERRRLSSQKVLIMEKLMDDLFKQSFAFLFAKEFSLAMTTLLQAINYVIPVYGKDNEYIPMIILLTSVADAQIGLKNISAAETSINCAMIRLKKLEDINLPTSINITRAIIHRCMGNLYYAKKGFNEAVIEYSEFVYYVTEEFGPKHFRTCHGYYSLAKCFLAKGQMDRGMAMAEFCINLCMEYLFDLIKSIIPDPSFWNSKWERGGLLSRYYEIETIELLRGVLKLVKDDEDYSRIEGRIVLCEAMLLFFRKYNQETRRHLHLLANIPNLEKDHSVIYIGKFIKQACHTEEQHFTLTLT